MQPRDIARDSIFCYVASVLVDTHKLSAKTIRRILRHKNLSTTEKYTLNINQDMDAVVNLLSTNGPHMVPVDKKNAPNDNVTS